MADLSCPRPAEPEAWSALDRPSEWAGRACKGSGCQRPVAGLWGRSADLAVSACQAVRPAAGLAVVAAGALRPVAVQQGARPAAGRPVLLVDRADTGSARRRAAWVLQVTCRRLHSGLPGAVDDLPVLAGPAAAVKVPAAGLRLAAWETAAASEGPAAASLEAAAAPPAAAAAELVAASVGQPVVWRAAVVVRSAGAAGDAGDQPRRPEAKPADGRLPAAPASDGSAAVGHRAARLVRRPGPYPSPSEPGLGPARDRAPAAPDSGQQKPALRTESPRL